MNLDTLLQEIDLEHEAQVNEKIAESLAFILKHQLVDARKVIDATLKFALLYLSPDHVSVGHLLAHLAYCELHTGQFVSALAHLETTLVIFSEWPEIVTDEQVSSVAGNLEYCKSQLE